MVNGYSIRKSAKLVEINIATSFFWRYKILDCISTFLGKGYVDSVFEADEVFFTESLKGTKPSNMPRQFRKRDEQVKKRGISKEQVYISNYIKWLKWLRIFDSDKEIMKVKNFMAQSNVTHSYIKVKDLKNRELVYVL